MKAFQLDNDKKHIYFRNLERRPGEEELQECIDIIQDSGGTVGEKNETPLADLYSCKVGKMSFTILFTGEEALISADNEADVAGIMKIFE